MAMKDVSQVVEELGMGRYQWCQIFICSTLFLMDGAEVLLASSILSGLETAWQLQPWMKGLFVSAIFCGVFIGNVTGGILADARGRRPVTIFAIAGVVLFGVLSSQAWNAESLLATRFLFGVFYGMGLAPSLTLLAETSPSQWRGQVVNFTGFFFMLGELFASVLLLAFMPTMSESETVDHWRYVTVFAVAPGIILLPMAILVLKESPQFLVSKGRETEALTVLKSIAAFNGTEEVVQNLNSLRPTQASTDIPMEAGHAPAASPADSSVQQQQTTDTWSYRMAVALSPEYRSIVLGGCYILLVANFLFFGLVYALPQVFTHMTVPFSPAAQVMITSFMDFPGLVVAILLVQSKVYGHRDGLIALACTATFALLAMVSLDFGQGLEWASLPSAYLAKYASSAFFALSYVYLVEVFPSVCRSTALSLCMGCGRLGSILAPPICDAVTTYSSHWRFFALAALLSVGAVGVIISMLTFERKNEPLRDELLTGKPSGVAPLTSKLTKEPIAEDTDC